MEYRSDGLAEGTNLKSNSGKASDRGANKGGRYVKKEKGGHA